MDANLLEKEAILHATFNALKYYLEEGNKFEKVNSCIEYF